MTIWHARCTTSHFEFDAFGRTEEEASAALRRCFAIHTRQYGIADRNWWKEYEDCIQVRSVEFGDCYRDGELLKGGKRT